MIFELFYKAEELVRDDVIMVILCPFFDNIDTCFSIMEIITFMQKKIIIPLLSAQKDFLRSFSMFTFYLRTGKV